jgi:hypothetical protein
VPGGFHGREKWSKLARLLGVVQAVVYSVAGIHGEKHMKRGVDPSSSSHGGATCHATVVS